jgi:hypothetical protein
MLKNISTMTKVDFLSWTATIVLIIGSGVNGLGYYPGGPLLLAAGGVLWTVVAILTRNWPLIATNVVMSTVGIATLTYTLTR